MGFLQTDTYSFLCIDNQKGSPKEYAIIAGGETWAQHNHPMVVIHKGQIKEIDWKDLGNTMQLIRLIPNRIKEINENTDMSDGFIDMMYSILERYAGYDELTNTSYHYIPKLSGEKLVAKLNTLDLFTAWGGTTILNEHKGWFTVHKKAISENSQDYILAEFFALCFLFGKPTIQKGVLSGYKIQIPIQKYLIQEKLESIIAKLRSYGFVINFTYNDTQQVSNITTSDYMLLAYVRILLGEQVDIILIDKVLEIQKEIYIHYGVSPDQQAMRRQLYEVKR